MGSSSAVRSVVENLIDDGAYRHGWPSLLNAVFALGLLLAGLAFGGSLLERVDTVLVGSVVGLISAYNLYRIAQGNVEHPDGIRATVLLGLWMIGVSLRMDSGSLSPLTDASLVFGACILVVNAVAFGRRFKNWPEKRRLARDQGPPMSTMAARIGHVLRRQGLSALEAVRRFLSRDGLQLNAIAILVGIVAGLGAVVFRIAIYAFQEVFFGATINPGAVSFPPVAIPNVFGLLAPLGPVRYLLVPAVGGLLVGLVVRETTTAVRGHGVPEVLEALMTENGRIDPKISIYKTLASSIAIGSGASLGREGPIVQIGSAAGSYFGQFVDSRYTRTLVAAGAGGGIAATFNTPLAGIMFALEIILSEYYLTNVVVVVLGATTATAVARAILGFTAAPGVHEFLVPINYHLVSPSVEFPLYILLGIVVAVVGAGLVKLLYATEHLFLDRLELPAPVKPAIGGGLLGLSILVAAVVLNVNPLQSGIWLFGVGYGTIHSSIAGELTLLVLVVLALMKAIGFALSIGSGSSGGVFSPSLYIGAMVGGAFGALVNGAIPGTASAGAYALVGTAGVFAAAASAPLTATLIIFELTGQYTIILPLLVVTVIGSEAGQFLLNRGTIYTEKLRDKGITIQERRIGSLEDLTAKDVMTADVDTIAAGTPLGDALEVFQQKSHHGLPIVDEENDVVGILVRSDLERLIDTSPDDGRLGLSENGGESGGEQDSDSRDLTPETPVEEIGATDVVTASPHTNLLTLVDRMARAEIGRVLIVDDDGALCGIVTRSDVLAAYDRIPAEEIPQVRSSA
ncbi:MAG: chloride channel protein [Halodesulfurarchaeum sp.]